MASNDSDNGKKRILVVNRSDNESGSRKDSEVVDDGHRASSRDGKKAGPDGKSTGPKDGKDAEIVVVLPKKATNLTPMGGPSLFNSDAEKIVIKTPDASKDGEQKKKIVVGDDRPEDMAPLGNVNGMFSNSNASENVSAAEKSDQKKSDGNEHKEPTNGDRKSQKREAGDGKDPEEKTSMKDKVSNAATVAAGAITGAAAAGAAAVGIKGSKNKDEESDGTKGTNNGANAPASRTANSTEARNHVSIDEKRNVNHNITRPNNVPRRLENVPENSIINEFRRNSSVMAEGFMYKKRPWLFCFWIQKYFILLRTGELLFVETDGTGSGSGDWNLKHANALNKIDCEGYTHPYRLAFSTDASTAYFAFDSEEERNCWFRIIQDASR